MNSDELRRNRVEVWAQVRAACEAADELVREAKRISVEQDAAAELTVRELPKAPSLTYSRRRETLRRALLHDLRPLLVRHAGEQQAAWCLAPLVIAFDERERVTLGPLVSRWSLPTLQLELLDIYDGGDAFYETLARHLDASGTYPLVFELYLLCLQQGFQGRYLGRAPERQAVIERLVDRVRREDPRQMLASLGGVNVPAAGATPADEDRHRVTFISFPYRYYVGAACLAVSVFLGLRMYTHQVVTHSAVACLCPDTTPVNSEQCLGANGR